jgi:NADPH:quinone reductase-like Zn-dependent oxidoreductase
VQIAKAFGAEVTAVCSAANIDLVHSIGADRAIDYTKEDFTLEKGRYDLFVDCIGNHSLAARVGVLKPRGIYVPVGGPSHSNAIVLGHALHALVYSWFASRKLVSFMAKVNQDDLNTLGESMATGKLVPVIDRRFKLSETAQAVRYIEQGHARGKVILTPD